VRAAIVLPLFLLLVSCTHVQSSGYVTRTVVPPNATSAAASPTPAVSSPAAPVVLTPVSATTVPEGAEEIGILEAHGRRPVARLDELLNEFRARIVSMGGNFGRIDQFPTKYEMVTETYTYDCGHDEFSTESRTVCNTDFKGNSHCSSQSVPVTRHVPKTCTGTRVVEAATLSLVGRAFHVPGETP
jgi:hypothetical protein